MKAIKDSVIYLLGEIIAKSLPFLLLPYLTRKLGTTGFGELSYHQTWFALLVLLTGLSQDGAVARYYYRYGKRFLGNILVGSYLYILFWAIAGLLFAALFSSPLLAILVGAACTQSLLAIQLSLRQCRKQAISYVFIQTIASFSTAILTILLLEHTESEPIFYRFLALLLGNGCIAIISSLWIQKQFSLRQTQASFLLAFQYLLAFGSPLLLHGFSNLLKGQFDRFFIFHHFTEHELGIYAAAFQTASIFSILLLALNKALVPHFFQALKTKKIQQIQIRRMFHQSLFFIPLPALLALLLPEKLYLWFLGAEYTGVKPFIILFLIGFSFAIPYYLLVNYLFYQAKNNIIARSSLISTLVYLMTIFILTPFGLHYIPLAMIIGNASILPLLYHQVMKPHHE